MDEPLFRKEIKVDEHSVVLGVTASTNVVILVDGWMVSVDEPDPKIRLRVALAARRLWKEALAVIPPGMYRCFPTTTDRAKLYLAAGWRPTIFPENEGELIYFHKIPPLPER